MRLVIKIGGSLMGQLPSLLPSLKEHGVKGLIVPGGGVFAELVRKVDATNSLSPHTSHMMAVAAMEQYGHMMADIGGLESVSEPSFHDLCVLLPYCMLARGAVELPDESWNSTSDTIAACIAHEAGASVCKLTDVDGLILNGRVVSEICASELVGLESTCVDANLPELLMKKGMDFAIMSGLHPERLVSFSRGRSFVGTLIRGR